MITKEKLDELVKRLRESAHADELTQHAYGDAMWKNQAASALKHLAAERDELRGVVPRGLLSKSSQYVSRERFAGVVDEVNRERSRADSATFRAEAALAELDNLKRKVTDGHYMAHAYRNMLGEKGRAVAAMWDEKHVHRVHFDWGPDDAEDINKAKVFHRAGNAKAVINDPCRRDVSAVLRVVPVQIVEVAE